MIRATVVAATLVTTVSYVAVSQPRVDVSFEEGATAGIVSELNRTSESYAGEATAGVVAIMDSSIALDGTDVATAEDAEVSAVAGAEDEEWANRLMANVDQYLSVRAEASTDAAVVGKLRKGDVAEITESLDGWTKITSGNVVGYVSNGYCVMGDDAKALASQICETKVISNTGGLRVRGEASEEGTILTAMGEGQKATLDNEAEAVEGWIAVNYYGKKGYVNAQYATIDTTYSTAITLAEEQEILEAQKKAAEQKQASYSQGAAVAASYDDVTLLAALIQCEGGNQPYEGQVGVGAVVVNRLHSGRYGSSISAVIYAPHQFGPAGTGAVARVAAAGPKASCMQAAQDALNGVSTVGGCTHFHRANGREGIVIGDHVFF
jgi:uncharacterized protein YgiM (DUF1202 family)